MEKLAAQWFEGASITFMVGVTLLIVGGVIWGLLSLALGDAAGWTWTKLSALLWGPLAVQYVLHHRDTGSYT
jgi:hypothetical protein